MPQATVYLLPLYRCILLVFVTTCFSTSMYKSYWFLLPQVTVYAPHQHTEAVLVFVTICTSSMYKMLLVFVTCQIMCTISSYKNCISLCCDMPQYVQHLNIQKLVGLCCHISQYVHHLNIQKLVWSLLPHITVCTPPQHATAGLVFVVTYHSMCTTSTYKSWFGLCCHISQYAHHLNMQQLVWSLLSQITVCGSSQYTKLVWYLFLTYHSMWTISTYKSWFGLCCHISLYVHHLSIQKLVWSLLSHITVCAPSQHTKAGLVFVATYHCMCTISAYKSWFGLCCHISQYVHHLNIQKLVWSLLPHITVCTTSTCNSWFGLCCHISLFVDHLSIQKLVWYLFLTYHSMWTISTYKSWFGLCCHISLYVHHLSIQKLVWSLLSHITVCAPPQHATASLVFVVTYHCMWIISVYKNWFGICCHISLYVHHLSIQKLVWSLLSHITVCGSSQFTKAGLVFVSHISQYVDHLNI